MPWRRVVVTSRRGTSPSLVCAPLQGPRLHRWGIPWRRVSSLRVDLAGDLLVQLPRFLSRVAPGWRPLGGGASVPQAVFPSRPRLGPEVISALLPFGRPETPHHEDARDHFHNLDHGHAMQDLVREMVHRERAPTLVGSAPNGLGSVPAGIKDKEPTPDTGATPLPDVAASHKCKSCSSLAVPQLESRTLKQLFT